MTSLDDLISTAETVVKKAIGLGAEEAECYISSQTATEAENIGGLVTASEGATVGAGIRATIGRRVGFASVSTVENEKLYAAAERAVSLARVRPEDPKFRHLPDPVKRPSKSGIFDESVESLTAAELIGASHKVFAEARSHEPISFVYGMLAANAIEFAVANSRGVNCRDRATVMGGYVSCKASGANEEKTAMDSVISRSLVTFDGLGESAANRAISSLGSQRLEPVDLPVIFDNHTSTLFTMLLAYGISARSVQEKRSALEGRLGEKVASSNVTIIDDMEMQDGIRTAAYDDEGVPTLRKPIIEEGVLKTYLYDSYSALLEGRESTGNGLRHGREPYKAMPSPSPINYYVKPGPQALEAIVRDTDRAVLARYELMGAGHSNWLTGDFSVVATNAYLVENGEVKHPLRPTTIAGNIYEAFRNVVDVGSDLRLDSQGKVPSLKISRLKCGTG